MVSSGRATGPSESTAPSPWSERVVLTIKGLLSHVASIPYHREAFLRELTQIVAWYNESRPHTWLGGKTPDERYFGYSGPRKLDHDFELNLG
jgi:transposase InsO family protein